MHSAPFQHPMTTNDISVTQPNDLGLHFERLVPLLPDLGPAVSVKTGCHHRAQAGPLGIFRQFRIKEGSIKNIL